MYLKKIWPFIEIAIVILFSLNIVKSLFNFFFSENEIILYLHILYAITPIHNISFELLLFTLMFSHDRYAGYMN